MNPIEMAFMQYHWNEDHNEAWKLLEQNAYLTASFMNPEGVKKAMGTDADQHASSDEEFEKTLQQITEYNQELDKEKAKLSLRKRKRKK